MAADLPHRVVRLQSVEAIWVGLFSPEGLVERY